MNCRFPDVTNLRCWLCPHNPHLHDLPIMSVHAILKWEEAERVRRPCWEDDEEFHNFDLLVPLPGELDDELTEMLADIGFSAEKVAMNRVTGEILYALSPITAEEKSSAADEAEPEAPQAARYSRPARRLRRARQARPSSAEDRSDPCGLCRS